MADLLEKMKQGSPNHFDLFYERYASFVYQIACTMLKNEADAEDICHDVFADVFQRPHSYDAKRGTVYAWLAVKTRHRCLDYLKKKKPLLQEKIEEMPAYAQSAEWLVVHRARKEAVEQALHKLPSKQREVLYGTYFEERTHRELAEAMNDPLGTIKSRIRYGLNKLKKHRPLLDWFQSHEGGKKNDW